MSTGDNIYSNFLKFSSGSKDEQWEDKFFGVYELLLGHIPMYAVPGNHDGNESESRDDLAVYLDNFFFPGGTAARWYRFAIGGLAEFFALDSTTNQESGPPAPVYSPGQPQSEWLREQLSGPRLPWRIAVMHHPMFTAGPEHKPSLGPLRHWFDWFRESGVEAVFAGHEHNFQVTERSAATGGMQFIVSGAGGQLRGQDIRGKMQENHISAWAPQLHFCVIEMSRDEILITPITDGPLRAVDANNRPVATPIRIPRTVELP
jgi:hypothetical protein